MEIGNWIRLGILGVILAGTFSAGSKFKQAQWDRAENEALKLQQVYRQNAEKERDLLNSQVFELQISLEDEELKAARLNDALQIEINHLPVVTTVTVETSDGCPVVQCNIPNAGSHYRLFNCAINNSCETLPATSETNLSDGLMSRSDFFAQMDGIYGFVDKDFSF